MKAKFYANMRTVIGLSELHVDDSSVDTFRKLSAWLIDRYPEARFQLLDDKAELRQDVPVYVDGRNPRLMDQGIDSPLPPDCTISFFSPISSGRMNVEILRDVSSHKEEEQ